MRLYIAPWLRLVALALLVTGVSPSQQDPRAKALCGEANRIARELTQITGLTLRHEVPCDFITKDKVNAMLKQRVKEVAKPEEIRAEELTLKKLGLVPPEFDLAKTTIELLTEQAAAFYDYEKKKLFITETTPIETQEPVLAHELSHALADQNFNLGKFIKQGRKSDDGSTARLAVMEGQATWLMSEYLARKLGQSLRDSPALVALMSNIGETGAGQFPIFESAPLYLRSSLIFPYTKGMLFQNALLQRDGLRSFAEVYRNPPVSSQQILHPEKYFAGVKPTEPELPDPKLGRGYKELVGGVLGELEHAILLEQFAGKERAAEIAPHWRGCTFQIVEKGKRGRAVLLYASEWESEEHANLFFRTYRQILEKKWRGMTVSDETGNGVSGVGDDGRFELRIQGTVVTSVEGMDPELN